jgi:bacterioferritin
MSLEYIRGIQEKVDRNEIVGLLRSALADELNAVHNYWMQAAMIQGYLREEINKELYQHRDEEHGHANMLIERIVQLGGNPDVRPSQWDLIAGCDYSPIVNIDQKEILEDAMQSEKCAVQRYVQLSQFLDNRDITTYDIVMKILEDEYQHINDLKKLQEMMLSKSEKEAYNAG